MTSSLPQPPCRSNRTFPLHLHAPPVGPDPAEPPVPPAPDPDPPPPDQPGPDHPVELPGKPSPERKRHVRPAVAPAR